jgi:hypothetical protein
MGKSTVNTTLTEQTNTSTTQTDQSGNQGFNFSDIGGGVGLSFTSSSAQDSHDVTQISTTDQGAVDAGKSLGLAGIAASSSALSSVDKINADSLKLLGGLVDKSIDASRTATRDAAANNAGFLDQALAGFKGLATQSSQSSDDRITKLVGMGLVALVLVVALPAVFKSGGKAVFA